MKTLNIRVALLTLITLTALTGLSNSYCNAQERVPQTRTQPSTTPIVIGATRKSTEQRPDTSIEEKIDALMKRIDALEAEKKKLAGDLFATKLLLVGLDKGVTTLNTDFTALRSKFEGHTHGLSVGVMGLDIKCEASIGNCSARQRNNALYLFVNNSSELVTSIPLKH